MMDPELLKKAIDFYDCTQSWHTSTRWGGYSLLEFLDLLEADKIIIAGGTEEEKIGRIQERCIRPALEKCELLADHYIQAMEALDDNRIGFRKALARYNFLTARIYKRKSIPTPKGELEEIQFFARQIVLDDSYIEMLRSEELKDTPDRKMIEQILYSYTHVVDPYEKHLGNCYWYFELIAQDQTYAFFEGYILKKLKTEEIDGIPKEADTDVKRYSIVGGALKTFMDEEGRMPNVGWNKQSKITLDKGDAMKLTAIVSRIQQGKGKPAARNTGNRHIKMKIDSSYINIGVTEQILKKARYEKKLPSESNPENMVYYTERQEINLSKKKKKSIISEFTIALEITEDGELRLEGKHAITGGELALIFSLTNLIRKKIGEENIGRYGELKKYPAGESNPRDVPISEGGRNLFSRNEILDALYHNNKTRYVEDYAELDNVLSLIRSRWEKFYTDERYYKNLEKDKQERYNQMICSHARPILSFELVELSGKTYYTFAHIPTLVRISEMMGHRVKVPSELLQLPILLDEKKIEERIGMLDSEIERIKKDIEDFKDDGRYIECSKERSRLSNQLRIMREIGDRANLWDDGKRTMSVRQSMNNAGLLLDLTTEIYRDDRLNRQDSILIETERILENYDTTRYTRSELIRNIGIALCYYAGHECMKISNVEYARGSRGISYRVDCAPYTLDSNNKLTRQGHLDEYSTKRKPGGNQRSKQGRSKEKEG